MASETVTLGDTIFPVMPGQMESKAQNGEHYFVKKI